MVFNKKNVIFVLLLSAVLFCAVSSSWAADIDVSDVNTNIGLNAVSEDVLVDSLTGVSTKNFTDIQQAIDGASEGDVINLVNTTYYGNGKSILVNKTVTIDGHGATLDAQNLSRIFEVTVQGVSFNNITFKNGNALAGLTNADITDKGVGGAIFFNVMDCDLYEEGYVTDCTFFDNIAYQGGAVFLGNVQYSIFYNNKASVTVDNETIGCGGAVSYVYAYRCAFGNNTAAEYGNSLYCSDAYYCIISGDNNDDFTVIHNDPILIVSDCEMYATESGYLKAYLEDGWGTPLANKTIIFALDEDCLDVIGNATTNESGIVIFELSGIPESFEGYAISSEGSTLASYVVIVNKTPVNINVDSYTATYGDTITLTVNLTDKDGKSVDIGYLFIDGYMVDIINGTGTYSYYCGAAGNDTVLVEYYDDFNYADADATINIKVNKLNVPLDISIIGNDSYKCSKVQINTLNSSLMDNVPVTLVFTDANGTMVLMTNVAIKNGVGTYTIPLVPGENYTVTALISNANVNASSVNATFNVTQLSFDLSISVPSSYYKGGKVTVKLLNYSLSDDVTVKLVFSNGKTENVVCKNGVGTYTLQFVPGTYKVSAYVENECFNVTPVENKSFKIVKASSSTITIKKLTTTYNSGKTYSVTVKKGSTPLVGLKVKLKVFTGKKYKWYYGTTNANGVASFKLSTLGIGTHKVMAYSNENKNYFTATTKTSSIVIKKATTTVSAPKVTNKYKASAYFKVTIKNKATGKVVSGLAIKIRVYTGKSYKTYTVKTNTNGVAQLNTKSFKKGTHYVMISSGNSKYTVSKQGNLIVIK
ncbi:MAG: hypothetical protein MJ224_07060 [archaeon]|nr:hypothetical protein [archaeon]